MIDRRRVTIHQVAKEAGVSRQTVSRVINNRPDVAPETRKRVQEVIEDLGYRPSAIARSLSRRRSYTIGVVIAGLQYRGPSRTINGITEMAEEMGYGLLLKELKSFDTNHVYPLLQWFLSHQVDGIIWAVPEVGENRGWLDEQLPDLPIPLLFMTMQNREDVNIVSIDNLSGGFMATQHLLEQGRKNIAHVSGPLDWWEARQRKQGWEKAMAEAGIQVEPHQMVEGTWSPRSGASAFQQLLSQYSDMDSIFVANDQMGLGVMQVACKNGIKIPEELSIVGFDGITDSEFYWSPLTTVFQNQKELGHVGVRELVALVERGLEGDAEVKPIQKLLKPELIIRESTKVG